jgi:hypothetical protein
MRGQKRLGISIRMTTHQIATVHKSSHKSGLLLHEGKHTRGDFVYKAKHSFFLNREQLQAKEAYGNTISITDVRAEP